jgi:uncharacterized protein (TIGR02285 family)
MPMKIHTTVFFFIVLLLMNGSVSFADTNSGPQNHITWYRADFPPVTIPNGIHADEGFFDKTMYFLIDRLPEYEHSFQTANFKRIVVELKNNNNVCCPSLYKTKEREGFVAFSLPAMIVLPNGIMTSTKSRSKLAPYINADGQISLLSLLKDDKITVGISSGRLYSGGIDQILKQFDGQKNLLVRSGNDVFGGLLHMMHLGRIDCVIGYPVETGFFVRENNQINDFIYYPIQESNEPFTVGHIGCPNNDWGRKVISRIDEIVKEYRDKEFIHFYGEWLDDSTREVHRKMAQKFYDSLNR